MALHAVIVLWSVVEGVLVDMYVSQPFRPVVCPDMGVTCKAGGTLGKRSIWTGCGKYC